MNELHNCEPFMGDANETVTYCKEQTDGSLWVGRDMGATRVNYCPFCGHRARVQVEWVGPERCSFPPDGYVKVHGQIDGTFVLVKNVLPVAEKEIDVS